MKSIDGLVWEKRWRLNNGQDDSFVVPFATLRPVNIVSHGEKEFSYGHYGIHLGQMDRLTFLGLAKQKIIATFIDCREGSPTARVRHVEEIYPSSERTLCIPPGVAHRFDFLENVFTLNDYKLFLPDPENWVNGDVLWRQENDVINLPDDIDPDTVPLYKPNIHEASEEYYSYIRRIQMTNLSRGDLEYPSHTEFTDTEGKKFNLWLKRKVALPPDVFNDSSHLASEILGVRWETHLFISSGENSGFTILPDQAPFYIVDHGEVSYAHDSYGIHVGQEDRLTFVGPSSQRVKLHLLDCRKTSETLHKKVVLEFQPSAKRFLVIPPGVAHRFENFEKVYTFNRAKIYLPPTLKYYSAVDVIDWPEERLPYPILKPNNIVADEVYYKDQADKQRRLMMTESNLETPTIQLIKNDKGEDVRLVLRKRVR